MNKVKYVSNEQQLREAIDWHFVITNGSNINITSKIILIQDIGLTKTLDIPSEVGFNGFTKQALTRQQNKSLIIDLCGNTIYDGTALDQPGLDFLIRRKPLNQKAANDSVSWSLKLRDGKLKGKSIAGVNLTGCLLYLGATYNSVIENIDLESAKNGIELRFCMLASYRNSLINGIDNVAVYVGKGDWDGAGDNISQSNSSVVEQVRVHNKLGATAFSIECSSQIVLRGCVSEGMAPKYHLLWRDYNNTTTVQDGTVENFYIEAEGIIKIQTKAGQKILKNIWMQSATKFEFEALSSVATIYLQNIANWPKGSMFECLGNSSNLAVRADEVDVDIRNNELWLNSQVDFPKVNSEIKGMPRYIGFNSSLLNKTTSTTNVRLNGILASPVAPLGLKTNKPTVITENEISGIADAGNNDGGMFITKRGIVCRIGNNNPTIFTNTLMYIDNSNGEGLFNYSVKNLLPKTTYTIRSFAYNGKDVGYGEVQIITTL